MCGLLPDHVPLQHRRQLFPTFFQPQAKGESVSSDSNVLVGMSRYVDLQARPLVVDVVPALIVLDPAGTVNRIRRPFPLGEYSA